MKIVAINTLPAASTGGIMLGIGKIAEKHGHMYTAFAGNWKGFPAKDNRYHIFGFRSENMLSALLARLTGLQNCFSVFGTIQLLKQIDRIKPDLIQLNNLHLNVINVPMLFRYLKKHRIPVFWTLHDCWTFTGHCPHFESIGCDKWKTGCYSCPIYRSYPASTFDNSAMMFRKKKKWYGSMERLCFIATSDWVHRQLQNSFLKHHLSIVIKNGIDLNVFKPSHSDFRKKNHCENKYLVLGVSFVWNKKKGLDVFCRLSEDLPDNYQVILVGVDEMLKNTLPSGIISIQRTQNQQELAELYSAADVFVNPTLEDTFPTVNLESLACGTPVVTFRSGGSGECLDDTCGAVVEKNDVTALRREITRACEEKIYSEDACVLRAGRFDMWECYEKYIRLYESRIPNNKES